MGQNHRPARRPRLERGGFGDTQPLLVVVHPPIAAFRRDRTRLARRVALSGSKPVPRDPAAQRLKDTVNVPVRPAGKILVVKEPEDRWIRYMKFVAAFEEDNEVAPVIVDAEGCVFPAAGQYVVEVFFDARGGEALKGEHPFVVSGQRSEPCPEESFCRGLLRYSTSLPNR